MNHDDRARDDDEISAAEAARLLSRERSTISNYVRFGKLPRGRIGADGRLMLSRAAVLRMLAERGGTVTAMLATEPEPASSRDEVLHPRFPARERILLFKFHGITSTAVVDGVLRPDGRWHLDVAWHPAPAAEDRALRDSYVRAVGVTELAKVCELPVNEVGSRLDACCLPTARSLR